MAETIIATSVTLIILLILIQKISVRFLYDGIFSVSFDYSFFSFIMTEKENKKGFQKISHKLFLPIKRAVEFWLSGAELKISEIKIKTTEGDPKKFSVKYRNAFSLFSALTVYLSKKTKKLSLTDDSIVIFKNPDEASKYILDVRRRAHS